MASSIDLLQADTYFCGTLRSNRIGVPRELPNIRLHKYDTVKWVKANIMVTKWKDKRNVYMFISTNNDWSDVEKQRTKFRREEIISSFRRSSLITMRGWEVLTMQINSVATTMLGEQGEGGGSTFSGALEYSYRQCLHLVGVVNKTPSKEQKKLVRQSIQVGHSPSAWGWF